MIHDNEAGNEVTDREIIMTRLLNAPRELVWKVWTQPEHLIKWWGPTGFTTTSNNMQLEPGGQWNFIMHGPDGRNYPNRIVFTEVKKPELLRYKHAGDEDTEPVNFDVRITFISEGRKTRLKMVMTFASHAELTRVEKEYGAIEGGKQHVASLEEYLTKIKPTEPFVIERLLNAPVALVWKAISNKEEMKKWYFDLAAFKPEVGFEFSFTAGSETKQYLHLCKVTVA
ncbi:MAG TPA: SRPBCC domain-containing protein, partial [Chitinophagales bacterium]|nr:SRPBCC domain-containing protein [Chitinophagales bacterium]